VNSLWITIGGCNTGALPPTVRDIYERPGALGQLGRHLYERTGVPMPDLRALAQSEISDNVRRLLASGNKIGAIKAYRDEANVDLPTATKLIESLSG